MISTYRISINDEPMGEWTAVNASAAMSKLYRTLTDWDINDSVEIFELNTEMLVDAIEAEHDVLIQEDSYGDGVVLIGSVSYKTYAELAQAYGFGVWDYTRQITVY